MRHLMLSACAMFAWGLFSASPILAQPTPVPTPTALPKKLGAVVVTAQRHPTFIDATSRHIWIVSSADLERIGAQTAADALRFIPGTVVQQYGTYGSLSTVALRGASSSQTLVLINGQPQNDPDTGLFDFSSLPANIIDRIEVVQGGSSTLYGSDAMGGVINILTKQPNSAGTANLYAQVGYRGAFTNGVALTFGSGDIAARVAAQSAFSNGEFDYPAFGGFYPGGTRSNSDAKIADTSVALSGRLGVVEANATLQNNTSTIGAPGSIISFPSGQARQQRVYQRMNLDFDVPLSRGDIDVQFVADGRRLHFYDPTPPFPFDTQSNGNMRGASVRATTQLGSAHVLTGGFDTNGDIVLFDFSGSPGGTKANCQGGTSFAPCIAHDASSAWYLQDEIHAPGAPLTLSLGVRNQRSQGTQSPTVPSLGAIVKVGDGVEVLANYARAFRTPNLDERYYPGFGDPTLQPEYAATFDVGMRANRNRSEYALAYFGQDTNNLIINVPIPGSPGFVQPLNVSRARVRGVESSLTSDVGKFAHATAAYTNFLRAEDFSPGVSGNRLLYRPTATAALGAWIGRGSWNYGIDSVFVGRRYADEANTQSMKQYVVTGLHVKKVISSRLALTMRIDNIGDNHHAEDILGYPVVGSAFSLRISTR